MASQQQVLEERDAGGFHWSLGWFLICHQGSVFSGRGGVNQPLLVSLTSRVSRLDLHCLRGSGSSLANKQLDLLGQSTEVTNPPVNSTLRSSSGVIQRETEPWNPFADMFVHSAPWARLQVGKTTLARLPPRRFERTFGSEHLELPF